MDHPPRDPAPTPPPLPKPHPLPSPALFSPIAEAQRHNLIDALRGIAILGIFLVNMTGFKAPMFAMAGTGERWLEGSLNAATLLGLEILASGKFVAMFALLFGMGMVMQEKRVRASGREFRPFFLRRMFVLLFLGITHAVLLWAGDILTIYALFGMFGLLFIRCRARTLFIWAAAVFGWTLLVLMSLASLAAFDDGSSNFWWAAMGDWWLKAYQTGTFGEIILARLAEWGLSWGFGLLSFIPYAFALFLFGMALGKIDFMAKLDRGQIKLRLFVAIALPAGLAASLSYAAIFHWGVAGGLGALALGMGGHVVGMLLLALAYAAAFSVFVRSGHAPALARRLAAVGRMALTNYLFQSLVANLIFMSWGFGLYGKVQAQVGLLIVIGVFILQLYMSDLWLRRFQLGPVEWVWRALSYRSLPRLRRPTG